MTLAPILPPSLPSEDQRDKGPMRGFQHDNARGAETICRDTYPQRPEQEGNEVLRR